MAWYHLWWVVLFIFVANRLWKVLLSVTLWCLPPPPPKMKNSFILFFLVVKFYLLIINIWIIQISKIQFKYRKALQILQSSGNYCYHYGKHAFCACSCLCSVFYFSCSLSVLYAYTHKHSFTWIVFIHGVTLYFWLEMPTTFSTSVIEDI